MWAWPLSVQRDQLCWLSRPADMLNATPCGLALNVQSAQQTHLCSQPAAGLLKPADPAQPLRMQCKSCTPAQRHTPDGPAPQHAAQPAWRTHLCSQPGAPLHVPAASGQPPPVPDSRGLGAQSSSLAASQWPAVWKVKDLGKESRASMAPAFRRPIVLPPGGLQCKGWPAVQGVEDVSGKVNSLMGHPASMI